MILATFFVWSGEKVLAQEIDSMFEEQEKRVDLETFDHFWDELQRETGEYIPDFHWRDIFQWVRSGEFTELDLSDILSGLGRFFFGEVLLHLNLLGQLLILAVTAALLKNLQTAFGSEQVAQLTQAVVFLVLMGLALKSFWIAMEIGKSAINQMVDFMLAIIPVLLMLLASLGNFSTAAIFNPLIVFMVNFFSNVVRDLVLPLIFFGAVLSLVNYFSPDFKLNRLADLFRDLSIWGMGLLVTVFVGITAIKGVTGTVADAVGLRAVKFATGAFIPVVGKMLADAVETVAGVSLLLKNSVSITGLLILTLITVFPLLKLLSLVLIYKLAAAIIQPLGDNPLGDCLGVMGNYLTLVFGAVAVVSIMFFMAIAIIMGAGNALLMLR